MAPRTIRRIETDPTGSGVIRRQHAITASGEKIPVAPPEEWFSDPGLDGPTPLTVTADGQVFGHIATWDTSHIGLPGNVKPPKSHSDYAFFRTGEVVTASGKTVPVGQLTLSGGHAPLSADASAAVKHYDDTASAVADLAAGEDRHGIWVAGAVRPDVTPGQIRALRASAPSGDWRPINGRLEMVALCQVNVPGFPVARSVVAGGEIMALVAAGAQDMYKRQMARHLGLDTVVDRLTDLESVVASLSRDARKQALRKHVGKGTGA